jgi:hypothetical protein
VRISIADVSTQSRVAKRTRQHRAYRLRNDILMGHCVPMVVLYVKASLDRCQLLVIKGMKHPLESYCHQPALGPSPSNAELD